MFYNRKLVQYRYANYLSNVKPYSTKYFVYSENDEDIMSIHGKAYTIGLAPTAFGKKLKILGARGRGFPQIAFLRYLEYMIGFRPYAVLTNENIFEEVFVGHADMIMEKIINIPTPISLLPTMRVADNLWIIDMQLKRSSTYFLEMFELNLWLTYFLIFIGIGVLSILGIYMLRRYTRKNFTNDFNWFSVFVNQGASETNDLVSRKILLLALSLLTIIFHASFEAFISSYLAIRRPDIGFNDLDGLMINPDYTICTPTFSPGHKYINKRWSNDEIESRLNNANCLASFTYDAGLTNSHQNRTLNCPLNKTAILISEINFRFNGSKQLCHFTPLAGSYFIRYFSIMVAPGWKYSEHFNQKLIVLRTSGVLSKFGSSVKYYKEMKEPNGTAIQIDDMSIDGNQTMYVFILLVFGIISSTAVLIFEVIVKKYF